MHVLSALLLAQRSHEFVFNLLVFGMQYHWSKMSQLGALELTQDQVNGIERYKGKCL